MESNKCQRRIEDIRRIATDKATNSGTIYRLRCAKENIKQFMHKDTPHRNWGLTVLLGASVFLLTFILFSIAVDKDSKWIILANIFGIIGGACLASGIFSLLLGFEEFTNYIIGLFAKTLYEGAYIKSLTETARNDLRYKLDSMAYGEEATNKNRGPYNFLTKNYPEFYNMPYREDYHEVSTYYINEKLPHNKLWCVDNKTSYILNFGHMHDEWIKIPFGYKADHYEDDLISAINAAGICSLLKNYEVTLGFIDSNEKINLKCYFDDCKKIQLQIATLDNNGDTKWERISTDSSKPTTCKLQNGCVDIFSNISLSSESPKESEASSKLTVSLDGEIFFRRACFPDGTIVVGLAQETYECQKDSYTSLTLSYPTLNFFAEYNIDHTRKFVFSSRLFKLPKVHQQIDEDINEVRITARGWLLPGHGCGTAWLPIEPQG